MKEYLEYINSTGTHWISNSGGDENGKTHGGKAGDQTGKEWQMRTWYNRPWSCVLRYPNFDAALLDARLSCAAALNNAVGYDQYQRTTYVSELERVGWNPENITTGCEEDCTAGVTGNWIAVGNLMNIAALKNLQRDTYSGNMRKRFVAAGFQLLTDSKYLDSPDYLLPGDVLLYDGHHAAANVSYGKRAGKPSISHSEPSADVVVLQKGDKGESIVRLQEALLNWSPFCLPKYGADGDYGSETVLAVKSFQIAYSLVVDGIAGAQTLEALQRFVDGKKRVCVNGGSVNVRKGAGTSYGILNVVHRGDVFEFTESEIVDGTRWYHIPTGWISGNLCSEVQ